MCAFFTHVRSVKYTEETEIELTGLYRESPPVGVSMLLNESNKLKVLFGAPGSGPHLALVTAWGSPHFNFL